MAVPDRYYGALFDRIGDSQFGARAARIRAARDPSEARTKNRPKPVFRNPSGTAIFIQQVAEFLA